MTEPSRPADPTGQAEPAARAVPLGQAGPAAGEPLDPRRWQALIVCVSALFMTLLDVSIVNVALPSIRTGLHTGNSTVQWVVSGYALAFGMVPIIGGRLGDDRGRRKMLLVGISGFAVTSAIAGLAPVPAVLLAGRLLQGVFGGLINPQVSGLVQQLFPRHERGRAFGVIGTAVGVSTASGPVIGGAILGIGGTEWGWRITFLINVPVGIVAYVLCRRLLTRTEPVHNPRPLDLPGALLLAIGVFLILVPPVEYDTYKQPLLFLIWLLALAFLAATYLWERGPARRRGHPLIDLSLFRVQSYVDGLGLALLYFCGYTGMPLVLSLFLQEGLGFSPLASGLTASAYALGAVVSAPIGGRLVNAWGRKLLVLALILFVLGAGISSLATTAAAGSLSHTGLVLVLVGPLFLAGLGGGSVITPNQALSLADVDVAGGSTAGGTLQTAQRIGSSIGTSVTSAVFYAIAGTGVALSGTARDDHYGHAYAVSLLVTVGFALAALALAVRDVRRPAVPPTGAGH